MSMRRICLLLLSVALLSVSCASQSNRPVVIKVPVENTVVDVTVPAVSSPYIGEDVPVGLIDLDELNDMSPLVGMTEKRATLTAQRAGWTVRITCRDNECYPLPMDYRFDRVNLGIRSGLVATWNVG